MWEPYGWILIAFLSQGNNFDWDFFVPHIEILIERPIRVDVLNSNNWQAYWPWNGDFDQTSLPKVAILNL